MCTVHQYYRRMFVVFKRIQRTKQALLSSLSADMSVLYRELDTNIIPKITSIIKNCVVYVSYI